MNDHNGERSRERVRAALPSLPGVERWFCEALIVRQLERGPNIPREVEKYGPQGTVKLCSARAFQLYTVVMSVVAIGLALASVTAAAGVVFALAFVPGALAITRVRSARRTGKVWRSRVQGRDESSS